MEKESVKKFDLEAAFKALDEIEIPQTKGIKANRVDLKERFGHKSATETLVEDYYDVSSAEDLNDAKEERDGEIAKAKLARIEKIVDLNAESPEDLLPSYVGKVIMQCPQCMTLFYKNPEDIEPSEENPDVVNLNEPCQHCGNTSGYTLIGKVGAVSEDEADKYDKTSAEENENELNLDFGKGTEEVDAEGTGEGAKEMSDEETKEESSDETSSDEDLDLDLNLDEVPEEEPEEEEKKEESLNLSKEASENESEHKSESLTLNEEIDKDLDEKLKAHNDYIAYLQQMIKQEEEALKKAENDEIKAAIQRRIDEFTADLEAALPDAVKAEVSVEDIAEEPVEEEPKTEEEPAEETAEEKAEEEAPVDEALTEETKECKVVLADKPEKEVFTGTKEECEKIIEKNKETKTAKEHGLKIVEPAANENKTEEKAALKESAESEIDSIIASWGVNEGLIKEDKSLPLRSVEIKDKENSKKGISWLVVYGEKDSLHKEFKNEEEAKKFAKENKGKLMPLRSNENLIKEDKSLPLRSIEVKDKENSKKGIGWQVIYGGKYNLHKEFKNEEEAKKFAKENNGKLMPIRTTEVGSLKEYWWEDNDPMNWSDKEPLVYSCYYNSELLGYLEYPYMGHEEYPTTIKADIIKHFKLPEGYNPKEISWRYIEKEPIDETKPLIQINESLTEEGDLDRLLDSDEFKTPVSEEEIDAARREVAKESLKEEKEDESMAPTIYRLFLDDKLVYESESIPLNKALSEITAYIKKLTPDQKKSFSLGWEFDESEHDGYCNIPIYDNEGNIVGSRTEWTETDGDIVVDVFSEAECKEYGYAFPEERLVVNVDYAGDAIRKALDDEESKEVEIEDPEFNEDDVDELDECSLNKHIDEYLKEVYSNVKSYKTTDCELKDGKLIVEGKISFNSGKEKLTMFEFLPAYRKGKLFFEGYNKDFSEDKAFTLNCSINKSKTLITESFGYKYKINKNLVKGLK